MKLSVGIVMVGGGLMMLTLVLCDCLTQQWQATHRLEKEMDSLKVVQKRNDSIITKQENALNIEDSDFDTTIAVHIGERHYIIPAKNK